MKSLLTALLAFTLLACGHRRPQEKIWIFVPGGGPRQERIQQLVQEMGFKAHFIASPQELVALRPQDCAQIRSFICFEGDSYTALAASSVRSIPRTGGQLFLVGESSAILEQPLGLRPQVISQNLPWVWTERARPYLAPGSFDPEDGTSTVYGYGTKQVPGWQYEAFKGDVWAHSPSRQPRWGDMAWGPGRVTVAGAALATLAANGDSQGARLLLDQAADWAGVPRLWPTPEGKGGIAVNVHVDSADHIKYLPALIARWPLAIRGTFHITAGPDCDQEGDHRGLDVLNPTKGRPWIEKLKTLGEIGSHGGWAHNVWADLPAHRREEFLARNHDALKQLQADLTSYSSPVGFHPQSINTWLVAHGIKAFYFTGDAGCPPTHTWQNQRPFGAPMWAFPVATDGDSASSYEFTSSGKGEAEAKRWGLAMVDFCQQQKALRLMYGHAIEWTDMPQAYYGWLNVLAEKADHQLLTAWTLTAYTDFLNRHAAVQWNVDDRTGTIRMEGPSLKDMALRLPGAWSCKEPGIRLRREGPWTWLIIEDNRTSWHGKLTR